MVGIARVLLIGGCLLSLAACSKTNEIDQSQEGGRKIGPGGGPVELDMDGDGVVDAQLRVPGGALTEEVTFQVSVAEPSEYPPLDAKFGYVGKVFAITPHGLDFLSPATVSLYNPTGASKLLRAEDRGSWQELSAQTNGDRLEATVTGLSFFSLGGDGSGPNVTPKSCSGRGPNGSSPTGSLTSASGTFLGSAITPGDPDIDMTTLVDGYAAWEPSNHQILHLVFTPYAKACGHYANGVEKIGGLGVVLHLSASGADVTTMDYSAAFVTAALSGVTSAAQPGMCVAPMRDGGGSACGSCLKAISITALDDTHVAGFFNFTPDGASPISGNFDLPFCERAANLDPETCCLP